MNRNRIRFASYIGFAFTLILAGLWLPAERRPLLAAAPDAPPAQAGVAINVDEIVASGFSQPVQVTPAGDGSGRLFVVEQGGYIRIIQSGGVLDTPFLDISGLVSCCGERGLLGLAFHPDYTSNGYFYIDYTRASDGATVIARYHVSSDPNLADRNSASILLTIAQPYVNHNGGQVMFGPDGYLYIGMGDGGSGGDPQNNAQNKNTLLGSLLRIDVDSGSPYAIPPDNPYVGVDGADEIWAIGLRNPWRFSFDRANGDLYIGDVGQNAWEEIDYQAANSAGGLNFGWHCLEGTHTYSTQPPCNDAAYLAGMTGPIAEYSHDVGDAVTGGFVYRGSLHPALLGRYFYADFGSGRIWSVIKTGSNPVTWSQPELELNSGLNISSFGEDESGELYVVSYSDGTIRHLVGLSMPYSLYFPFIARDAVMGLKGLTRHSLPR
jgi:glucose/arabinose dehydrogenase